MASLSLAQANLLHRLLVPEALWEASVSELAGGALLLAGRAPAGPCS